jgi:hypothetical protein
VLVFVLLIRAVFIILFIFLCTTKIELCTFGVNAQVFSFLLVVIIAHTLTRNVHNQCICVLNLNLCTLGVNAHCVQWGSMHIVSTHVLLLRSPGRPAFHAINRAKLLEIDMV